MGLIATTVAVALGLLISSVEGFYHTQSDEITRLAANYIMFDRNMAYYGPNARDVCSQQRAGLTQLLEPQGPLQGSERSFLEINSRARLGEKV